VLPELDTRRLAALRPGAIVMYPVPYDRGVESTEDVFIRRWRYGQQVASGVFICMAVLISSSTERARLLVRAGIRRFNVLLSSHQLPGARV